MLARRWRVKAKNETGQTLAANAVKATVRRWKLTSAGAIEYEAAEGTVLDNGATVANNAFVAGTTQSNETDLWMGAHILFEVTAPASSSGAVILYLERATDAGTNFDDDGLGAVLAVLTFSAAGTKRRSVEV